jgi:hypothetical protein
MRSRSTLLVVSASEFYNISIIKSDWLDNIYSLYNHLDTDEISSKINFHLEEYYNKKNLIIKFHPGQLLIKNKNPKLIDLDLFRFKQYDKIFFTFRDSIADQISSQFIAEELGKWTYNSKEEIYQIISPREIPDIDPLIKGYIISDLIINTIKEYLFKINLPYENLYYNDIPKFVNVNYPKITPSVIESNYNYKEIIINYKEIINSYNQCKEQITEMYYREILK